MAADTSVTVGSVRLKSPVIAGAAGVCGTAAATRSWAAGAMLAAVLWVIAGRRRLDVMVVLVAIGSIAGWRSEASWRDLAPDRLGEFTGWVAVVDDPQPLPGSTRAVLEVEGERFEMRP